MDVPVNAIFNWPDVYIKLLVERCPRLHARWLVRKDRVTPLRRQLFRGSLDADWKALVAPLVNEVAAYRRTLESEILRDDPAPSDSVLHYLLDAKRERGVDQVVTFSNGSMLDGTTPALVFHCNERKCTYVIQKRLSSCVELKRNVAAIVCLGWVVSSQENVLDFIAVPDRLSRNDLALFIHLAFTASCDMPLELCDLVARFLDS